MRGQITVQIVNFLRKACCLSILAGLLILLPACIPLTGAAGADPADLRNLLNTVQRNGILVIATDNNYPPQSQFNPEAVRLERTHCSLTHYTANQMVGFDIDVGVEVARRLGVEPCFVTPAWSQLVGGNWGGRWDISVGSMAITSERMQALFFTQPYTSGAAVIFVHQDNETIRAPGDLTGKRVGVCTGCAYEAYLDRTLEIPGVKIQFKIQNAAIVGYDTDTSALDDLALGDGVHLDAVMTDPDTGELAIQDGLPIRQVGEIVYHDYVAIAIDKSSNSDPLPLVMAITEVIDAMHQDGTLRRLSEHYYQGDFTSLAAAFDFAMLNQQP